MEFVSCDPSNYRAGRTQPVRYIVMHYTANNGDTAKNNCDYYHRVGGLQASAHYFVDEHGAMQSVREGDTAWHCGARAYWHPECRNANSIGIEMCSRKRADGSYYIKPETVANAAALALRHGQHGAAGEHAGDGRFRQRQPGLQAPAARAAAAGGGRGRKCHGGGAV